MKKLIFIYGSFIFLLTSCTTKRYLFTSFHEPANEGLRYLYSMDGKNWEAVDTVLLKPAIGKQKVMRDPSIARGEDGIFHLVWTSSWQGDKGFGHASSKDLIHWSEQEFIPVLQDEPIVVNTWAPEIYYDKDSSRYIIVWASCIPGRFDRGIEADSNNHRLYYTETKDFKSFTPSKLFLDPGFSVIDAEIVQRGLHDYVLVLKDNTRPERNIKVAFGETPLGPWKNISKPFTEKFTEGPSVLRKDNEWLIYFDAYQAKKYSAVSTKDFIHFSPVLNDTSIPEGHKHGTIVEVTGRDIKRLLKAVRK